MSVSYEPFNQVADGEWARLPGQEALWVTVDVIGTKRNFGTAIQSGCEIANTATKVSTAFGGVVVPILQILGGIMVVGSAIKHTIPQALKELGTAKQELELADLSRNAARIGYAKEGLTVARLGVANQSLYLTMGGGLIASGTLTTMSPLGAELFKFQPVVGSGAAAVGGAVLGGIYVVRGAVILGRSIYNLHYLNQFEDEFRSAMRLGGETKADLENAVDLAIGAVQKYGDGSAAQQRRIGDKVAGLPPQASLDQKIAYLEEVDKGLHEKKLQQKISIIIGLAMFLGGIAAIAAIFFSGGLALPLIALISAIAFALMEVVYATYDSSVIFEKVRARCYTPSQEIQALRALHEQLKRAELEAPLPPAHANQGLNFLWNYFQ